jgi:hypothetical protein
MKELEMSNADNLLKQVSLISQKYDAIAKITGENYNIFEILDVRSDELSHSKILTDLLNPKGSHCCGEVFLKLFFEKFLPNKSNVDFSKCQVYKEYSTRYGRLDIYIDCLYFGIVIENKIYAGDQYEQLKRYNKFLNEKFKEENYVFYLTLDGKEAEKQSSGNVGYVSLSYCNDILDWLELCQKEVFNKSLIRETLEQYKNLLKILTHQTRSKEMSKEIIRKITETADNYKSAVEIGSNLREAKDTILCEYLLNPLGKWVEEEYKDLKCCNTDLNALRNDPNYNKRWFGFQFYKEEWDISIRFQFSEKEYEGLYYALGKREESKNMANWVEKLKENGKKDAKDDPWQIWYEDFPVRYGLISKLIEDPEGVLALFKEKIKEMMVLLGKIGYEQC